MRRTALCVVFVVLSCATASAANPVEWFFTTNGWGWSNGYHSYNGCVQTGRKSWTPTNGGYAADYGPQMEMRSAPLPGYPGVPPRQPTPAREQLPAPEPKRPQMQMPEMNMPAMEARSYPRFHY